MKFNFFHGSSRATSQGVDEQPRVEVRTEAACCDLKSTALQGISLKRILVPTDFSECAAKAVQYAVALAAQFGSQVTLLHVVRRYPPVPQMAPVDLENVQDAEQQIQALAKSMPAGVQVNTVVRIGEPHAEVARAATNLDADLIVVSTHGRTGMSYALMGSTAAPIIRHAPCPVLVVREKEHEFVQS